MRSLTVKTIEIVENAGDTDVDLKNGNRLEVELVCIVYTSDMKLEVRSRGNTRIR